VTLAPARTVLTADHARSATIAGTSADEFRQPGAGQHRDGLDELEVDGQRPVEEKSVRSTLARTTESPWSDSRPATECRSR
jgi:hypothetical protein